MQLYTLGFIKQGSRVLMLNREKAPWMGCWNGVGGKVEQDEKPWEAMLREIKEETDIDSKHVSVDYKGLLTWSNEQSNQISGALYLYLLELSEDYRYDHTPVRTDEGILDWKAISWIMHSKNIGVASNISRCLDKVLYDQRCYHHHSTFSEDLLVDHMSKLMHNQTLEELDVIKVIHQGK
ncbi:NUDIX hydrolase [Paenibacillus sp. BIC5C1]|uniref:NUDIX hydrolase n=1 Tax=Paenibacillus sp. BIC5C1 TaxID=3078263 RepID=UPI0028EE7DDD|nr:NUDIX domain-containing protein [Paenibacillus sp. BIC5C1]